MNIWGSDSEIGDTLYHVLLGEVVIHHYTETGLVYVKKADDVKGDLVCGAHINELSWVPFETFDRGKKKAMITKWKWIMGNREDSFFITNLCTEEDAHKIMIEHNYEWKQKIDKTEKIVEE